MKDHLCANELTDTEMFWVKKTQLAEFSSEITGKELTANLKILMFWAFLDQWACSRLSWRQTKLVKSSTHNPKPTHSSWWAENHKIFYWERAFETLTCWSHARGSISLIKVFTSWVVAGLFMLSLADVWQAKLVLHHWGKFFAKHWIHEWYLTR